MSVSKWTAQDVVEWLKGLPIPISTDLCSILIGADIDGPRLLNLDHARLTDLRVTALGHREVILSSVKRLAETLTAHRSDYCRSLAEDIVAISTRVAQFLCMKFSLPAPTVDGGFSQTSPPRSMSPGLRHGRKESDGIVEVASGIKSAVCDLLFAARQLALWLDRSPVQDFTVDYSDFRDILLRCALFVSSKFKDSSSHATALVEKCAMLSALAISVLQCLETTPLGDIRPVKVKVSLPPAEENSKGWGFSVKCCHGLALVNNILPDTPAAWCSNLRARDELAAVDDSVVTSWAFENITSKLRTVSKYRPLSLDVVRNIVRGSSGDVRVSQLCQFRLTPAGLSVVDGEAPGTAEPPANERGTSGTEVNTPAVPSSNDDNLAAHAALVRSVSLAQTCDDEGSSREASDDESDAVAESTLGDCARVTNGVTSVKACVSDSAVSVTPHRPLHAKKSSISNTSGTSSKSIGSTQSCASITTSSPATGMASPKPEAKNMEFGYRTQIVGGVVMRIPVTPADEQGKAGKSSKKSAKSKWSILSSRVKKSSADAPSIYQGFGAADFDKQNSGSKNSKKRAADSESPASRHTGSSSARPEPGSSSAPPVSAVRQRASDTDLPSVLEGNSGSGAVRRDVLRKKRSTQSLSRLLDKETAVGDCAIPAYSLTDPTCKGWLTKQGNVKKNWKRRWFVLKDMCLYYYRTPSDAQALNAIPLPSYSVEIAPDVKKNYSLRLVHKNTRTFLWYCDSFEDMIMWLDAIKVACGGGVPAVDRPLPESEETTDSVLTESTRL